MILLLIITLIQDSNLKKYERDFVKKHKIYKDETYETDHFVALIDEGTNMCTTSETVVGYDPDKALTPDWVH